MEVQNYVPSDGGVTITITAGMGRTEQLLFPSLFTVPPPSQATMDLYDVVRRVQVGDRVRADGTRTASGIALESLVILPGHGL